MTEDQTQYAKPDRHPSWCVPGYCTAYQGRLGAHRSTPIIVNERPLLVTANLYSSAMLPDDVLVEARGLSVLLPASVAYSLGRVLVSLGKAGSTDE